MSMTMLETLTKKLEKVVPKITFSRKASSANLEILQKKWKAHLKKKNQGAYLGRGTGVTDLVQNWSRFVWGLCVWCSNIFVRIA